MSIKPTTKPLLYPLVLFHDGNCRDLPSAEIITCAELPSPYRDLLYHDNDLTPTLEGFYGDRIHLRKLNIITTADLHAREVILELDRDRRAVSYGANHIYLENFPPACIDKIMEGYIPMGTILMDMVEGHHGGPDAYFRITANRTIEDGFRQSPLPVLYGRRNAIFNARDELLSEVLEILAPVA